MTVGHRTGTIVTEILDGDISEQTHLSDIFYFSTNADDLTPFTNGTSRCLEENTIALFKEYNMEDNLLEFPVYVVMKEYSSELEEDLQTNRRVEPVAGGDTSSAVQKALKKIILSVGGFNANDEESGQIRIPYNTTKEYMAYLKDNFVDPLLNYKKKSKLISMGKKIKEFRKYAKTTGMFENVIDDFVEASKIGNEALAMNYIKLAVYTQFEQYTNAAIMRDQIKTLKEMNHSFSHE